MGFKNVNENVLKASILGYKIQLISVTQRLNEEIKGPALLNTCRACINILIWSCSCGWVPKRTTINSSLLDRF